MKTKLVTKQDSGASEFQRKSTRNQLIRYLRVIGKPYPFHDTPIPDYWTEFRNLSEADAEARIQSIVSVDAELGGRS